MTNFQTNNSTSSSALFVRAISNCEGDSPKLSDINLKHIAQVKGFSNLEPNWDGYNANIPSDIAISKAIEHIFWLNRNNVTVFFSAPTRDGDILIEVKEGNARVEFIFSADVHDKVLLIHNEDVIVEYPYYNSNASSYIKWLICPNGDCPDFR
ncbi:MAG: hypothetical protein IPN14_12380 [Bacteroidetes bacterium]|nr:hypothetical protein [Bacteroidota bacterium]